MAYNSFSFQAITANASLSSVLSSASPKDRNIFYPKEKIYAYSRTIAANRLASILRPVITYYFGLIGDEDTEFMERCYVSQIEYGNASEGMTTIIHDCLSPYLEAYGVKQLDNTGKGGRLGGKLTKNLKKRRIGEVLVLFGGKGAGKSTFLKRLLFHKPPRWLLQHAVIAIVDLLRTPEDRQVIRFKVWNDLIKSLDVDKLLKSDRSVLTQGLFADKFETALRQELSGLDVASETYNLRLNELVAAWKQDLLYCAVRLVEYLGLKDKGVIIVVDNTDQYSSSTQDFCFSAAQEISDKLGCITLISMREERFHDSKIHGLLDAFQNSGFHISSPKPADVFRKRLQYLVSLLGNSRRKHLLVGDAPADVVADCIAYLSILTKEFGTEKSPLNNFLTACAHGDIRLSLDLFRSFLLSGYTNVDEMIAKGSWNFQIHQVIKPVMIPSRFFYDEGLSDIPNVYQIRHNRNGSHFTALRILRKLAKTMTASSHAYVSVPELLGYFAETFSMEQDFKENLDVLLKHGFVESNNRLDSYSDSVDKIKITNYGSYMLRDLAHQFAYLDLICTDCGLFEEEACNYVIEAATKEVSLLGKSDRVGRVELRLERVGEFLTYMNREENRERDLYNLGMPEEEMFTVRSLQSFEEEQVRVRLSARKQSRSSMRKHGRGPVIEQ